MSTNDKLADALYQAAATAVCEARNTWNAHHEENWLEDGGALHPDDFIGRAVVDAVHPILAASLAAPPAQGEWVPELPMWTTQKPTSPGVYGVRGFNLLATPEEQVEAVVRVQFDCEGDLVCNLHARTSSDDLSDWPLVEDCSDEFEWCRFDFAGPQPAPAPVQHDRNAQAAAIVRSIAGMGFDSSDREIADEAIRLARRWRDDDEYVHAPAQPPAPGEAELPPLPINPAVYDLGRFGVAYSAEQMHAYARAAIAALAQQRVPDAVDLRQFRESVECYGAEMRMKAITNKVINANPEVVRYWQEKEVEATRLLALIDQQQEARGNG